MNMTHGWAGKILRVNLSTGSVNHFSTQEYGEYIGGLGIGARIAWEEIPPLDDAFDERNKLLFFVGPLAGIPLVAGASRASLCGVSPHTHPHAAFTYSSLGGDWPTELKFAGYDGVIVEGVSDRPVYLLIADERVEIREAAHLWGKDTYETQKDLANDFGDTEMRSLCIGPAGENRVRFASIQSDTGTAFGHAGFGAVMGSKNLKAIAVRGTGSVSVAKPKELLDLAKYATRINYGIAVPGAFEGQIGPRGRLWGMNSGVGLAFAGYGKHGEACRGCALGCRAYFDMPEVGAGQGMCVQFFYGIARDPQHDGTELGDKPTWLAKTLSDSLGLNAVEAGGMLFWLRDAFKEGIFTEKDLPMPRFLGGTTDDEVFVKTWLEGIAYRKGFGDLLAEGTARAAEHFGDRSWDLYQRYFMARGMHTHWCNSILGCLEWAMDSRDPFNSGHDYLYGVGKPEVAKYAWGNEDAADPLNYDHVPHTLKLIQHSKIYKDMLCLCDFAWPCISTPHTDNGLGDIELPVKLLVNTTGIDIDDTGLQRISERVVNLMRAIAVREGRTREQDTVYPSKFDQAFFYNGMARMFKSFGPLDAQKWEEIKDRFYEERGWDLSTGWPTEETLTNLALADVAEELKELDKLPTAAA